jgi:ureidoglycolate hydrolase
MSTRAANTSADTSRNTVVRQQLSVTVATPATFAPYGQVIMPMDDGIPYGPDDAQLDLAAGIPRFYSMQLHNRGNVFRHITRHKLVTQCLGSMLGATWMLGVAEPSPQRAMPDLQSLKAFIVPRDRFIKLHRGTWHAGPYFAAESALFYNLELSDTNVTDHDTCHLPDIFGLEFEFAA